MNPGRSLSRKTKSSNTRARNVKKNDGTVMRNEVQRYKDKEKSMQDGDGGGLAKKRISRQGTFNRGKTSGVVKRDFGLSKESQARAEANLSRIIELANNSSGDVHARGTSLDTPSELGKDPSPSPKKVTPKNNKALKSVDASVSEKKKSPKSSPGKPTSVEEEEDVVQITREHLAVAAVTGIVNKSRLMDPSSSKNGRLKSSLNSLKAFLKDSDRNGHSGLSKKLKRFRKSSMKRPEKSSGSSVLSEVPETPSSEWFLQVTPLISSVETVVTDLLATSHSSNLKRNASTKLTLGTEDLAVLSSPGPSIPCPGTTIINPRALLVRYEEKLKKNKNAMSSNVRSTESSNVHSSVCDKNVSLLKNNVRNVGTVPCVTNKGVLFENTSTKDSRSEDVVAKAPYTLNNNISDRLRETGQDSSFCQPKSATKVIINPLDYLERYENETDSLEKYEPVHLISNASNQVQRRSLLVESQSQIVPKPLKHVCPNSYEEGQVNNSEFSSNSSMGSNNSSKGMKRKYHCDNVQNYRKNYQNTTKKLMPDAAIFNHVSDNQYVPRTLLSDEYPTVPPCLVDCRCRSKDAGRERNLSLLSKSQMVNQQKYPSCSAEFDVLEEGVVNDFVFKRYVDRNSDLLKMSKHHNAKNLDSQNRTQGGYSLRSGQGLPSNSSSRTDAEEYSGWMPNYYCTKCSCNSAERTGLVYKVGDRGPHSLQT